MATAVQVIFGANSTQFQAELARMQTMAGAAGRRIGGSMGGAHGHGFTGQTGVVRETAVIGREIAMGRGMGRILASLTLLSQYLNSATRNANRGVAASEMLADAYEKMAVKARLAAIAALKKAEASAAAAEMDGFEDASSIAVADANALEANNADAAAVALEAKAVAARRSAAADEAAAAAAATAVGAFKAMLVTLGFFALLLVIIAEAYIVFSALSKIINRKAIADKEAADYAREHTLAIWEEIEAMENARDATAKATEALKKLNEAKDHQVELTRDAIEASNAEAEAHGKLYDAGVKGKLLDIEIAEKKGLITHEQAIQQKSDIEAQAVTDKAAAQQSKLDAEAKIASDAAAEAQKEKLDADKKAQAAIDKTDVDKSPEAKKRVDMLAEAEKDLNAAKSDAAKKKEKYDEVRTRTWDKKLFTGLMGSGSQAKQVAGLKDELDAQTNAAASAELRVAKLKQFMKPDEVAAAETSRIAGEKTNAAATLSEQAKKASEAAALNKKNSPAEVAAEKANIAKQKQLEDLSSAGNAKGYSLNSNQKIGAYAATAPVLLQQLNALRVIQHNTTPAHPPSNHPPGERKPQFGPVHKVK